MESSQFLSYVRMVQSKSSVVVVIVDLISSNASD